MKSESDCHVLQDCLDEMFRWSSISGMRVNVSKCKQMPICKNKANKIVHQYGMDGVNIEVVTEYLDSGILVW